MIYKIELTKLIEEQYEVKADSMDRAVEILDEQLESNSIQEPVKLTFHTENIISEKGFYE